MAEWDIDTLVRIQQALNAAYGPDGPAEWEVASERECDEMVRANEDGAAR